MFRSSAFKLFLVPVNETFRHLYAPPCKLRLDSPGLPCFVLPHVQKMGESLQKACILCLNVIIITIHAVTMNQHPSETQTVLGRKYLNDIAYHESVNNTIQ